MTCCKKWVVLPFTAGRGTNRNGTSFATIRFAADADTATFVAASETVLEPGDVLIGVAPATPDDTPSDVGFTSAGALVV